MSQGQAPRGESWFDASDPPARADLATCIHCGLCLTSCPTYRELRTEPDSPRGRIDLMRGLADGRIAPDPALTLHLDRCLDCRACETVCPAGVPYSRMLEATRGQLERRTRPATPLRTLGRWVLRDVLPHPGRVALAADLLRLGQSPPLRALADAAAAHGLLPRFASQGLAMTPPIAPRSARALARVAPRLPRGARMEPGADGLRFVPAGAPRGRVALHATCVMEALLPEIHRETVRLLVLAGVEVTVPRAQSCCGALHAHAGLRGRARELARANVRAFAGTPDFVVSHSAGCGAALRDAGHLLDDPAARAFSAKVRDISEVLDHFGLPAPQGEPRPLRVAYHDPCHLAHAQGVRVPPRRLLRATPGVTLVDLPNSDWCCGSAGIYNLQQPALADAQLEGKLDGIAAVAPDVVVASNPGCLLHMRRGAAARGSGVRIVHLVEVLGAAHPAGA